MANIAASLDPTLPFPFPTLEAELPDGTWKSVPVVVGVPAGKTKTILVDLDKKLPAGTKRLKLSMAFELYWDSVLLCEKISGETTHISAIAPDGSELRWRGFSRFAPPCDTVPLTPEYDQVDSTPSWRRTPSGWCTRYGPVGELIEKEDDQLLLLNGGDELALSFPADRLPPKPAGAVREFFLFAVGWDKDADFHVGQGWRVDPLPFKGMDDQTYGREPRPGAMNDSWIARYNTRWVGPMVLAPLVSASLDHRASAH